MRRHTPENTLFVVVAMPPSGNKLYYNKPHGGRGITTAGKAWRDRALAVIHDETNMALQRGWSPADRYVVRLTYHFKEIENRGWYEFYKQDSRPGVKKPHKAGDRKAESRWKAQDVDNRLKATLDMLKIALGVDDRAHFPLIVDKDETIGDEGACVIIEVEERPWVSTRQSTTST